MNSRKAAMTKWLLLVAGTAAVMSAGGGCSTVEWPPISVRCSVEPASVPSRGADTKAEADIRAEPTSGSASAGVTPEQ